MEGLDYYDKRKVFIILKNKRQYTGYIINIDRTNPLMIFFTIIDKFGNHVTFNYGEIDVMEEEKDE